MIKVVILGSGNVAQHLYTALSTQKLVDIVQCYNRKGVSLHPDQNNDNIIKDLSALVIADVYILAISDDAIEDVSVNLPFSDRLVVHTSGSVPMNTIKNTNRKGVFYPLQTLSKNTLVDYTKIPFCIEAQEKDDTLLLKKLASFLSPKVYEISSEQRNVLHVSAVFVNNFTNYMFTIGNDICDKHGVPFEILHPLIQETAQKIQKITPEKVQTGPAIRNDTETIKRHKNILTDTTHKKIYETLTRFIQSKYGKKL